MLSQNSGFGLTSKIFFMKVKLLFLSVLVLIAPISKVFSQEKKVKLTCVAFYNCENLYDTLDQEGVDDFEFTPKGPNNWNSEKYAIKMQNLSQVISQIGGEFNLRGPVIIGLSEIENRSVLEDLINTELLKPMNYGIAHIDGPDKRGVDVALLYSKEHFIVTNIKSVRLTVANNPNFLSRDQLVVSGLLDGDPIHFVVNHWPSRRGGEKRSYPFRGAAADLSRSIVDSLTNLYPNAKVVVMGDLNDNPTDPSVVKNLKAKPDTIALKPNDLFNPMYTLYKKKGIGTTAYRDSWSLFDQIIITEGVVSATKGYKYMGVKIFNRPFLLNKEGAFTGYPLRTYVGNTFQGGYSDHFPVYIILGR